MTIRIHSDRQDYLGLEVFDYLMGYWQYVTDYQITPSIKFDLPAADSYNILFLSLPERLPHNLDQYDLVLLDNTDEPFGRGTDAMLEIMNQAPHARLLCNAILPRDHAWHNRIVSTCIMWELHRRYYTMSAYPQRYEFINSNPPQGIVYINGKNRSVREHLSTVIQHYAPSVVHHNDVHQGTIFDTEVNFAESSQDTEFRIWADQTYSNNQYNNNPPELRWPPLPAGINGRFGATLWEDRFLDVFRNNQIIVYPETTWTNQQLSLNEKSLKCFLHQRLPMMVGGAATHRMYNDIGFCTAWNLLPPEYQEFDSVLDHRERYIKQAQAIDWLSKNLDIYHSDRAQTMLINNQARSIVYSSTAGQQLYDIIHAA